MDSTSVTRASCCSSLISLHIPATQNSAPIPQVARYTNRRHTRTDRVPVDIVIDESIQRSGSGGVIAVVLAVVDNVVQAVIQELNTEQADRGLALVAGDSGYVHLFSAVHGFTSRQR